jgi:hypothetical protein
MSLFTAGMYTGTKIRNATLCERRLLLEQRPCGPVLRLWNFEVDEESMSQIICSAGQCSLVFENTVNRKCRELCLPECWRYANREPV